MAHIIAVINQKGGVGKTTTVLCLGAGLARKGKSILLIDLDAQGSLSIGLGCDYPDRQPVTMAEIFRKMKDTDTGMEAGWGILPFSENLSYVPAGRRLSFAEQELAGTEGGELFLKRFLSLYEEKYDYILLDCPPSFGMVVVNALTATDSVLIPAQTEYLAVKGLEQMLSTVIQIRRRKNANLRMLGILPVMVHAYTRDGKKVLELLRETYGESIGILPCMIPYSVRLKEVASRGKSIYELDKKGKAAQAYERLTEEILLRTGKGERGRI